MKEEQFRTYLLEYYHNGAKWNLNIPATSTEDAQERARQIYHAKILGTVEMELPVKAGFAVRAFCWLKNALS